MRLIWILFLNKDNSKLIKNIKLDLTDYSPTQIKNLIFKEFQLDCECNIRLRNTRGCLVPINQYIDDNCKPTAYILETYKVKKNSSERPVITNMLRPVTNRPEVKNQL
jgi:hypothetical protein